MSSLEIRLCKSWDECVQCEELQKNVWDMPDWRDVVPANLLITAIKNGGLLVGAFEGERMLGFAFGFLGSEGQGSARRFKHTSHMLAVVPKARASGLGAALKWRQREEALKQGLDLMTWTYDPLQAVNASLNLTRLGGIARRYIRDAYGEMTDALNAGLASDRFEVEWELKSDRVASRATAAPQPARPADAKAVFEVKWDAIGQPRIVQEFPLHGDAILVEIPVDVAVLKAAAPDSAIEWRARTRGIFEQAFKSGFAAVEFFRGRDAAGPPRSYYLLEKVANPRLTI